MAELRNYLVKRGHIYKHRVRAVKGDVLTLDSTDDGVRSAVFARRLVETDEDPRGELQEMGPQRFSWMKKKAAPAPEPETALEEIAARVTGLNVEDLLEALGALDVEELQAAGAMEGSKDKPRKGALEAFAEELESRG